VIAFTLLSPLRLPLAFPSACLCRVPKAQPLSPRPAHALGLRIIATDDNTSQALSPPSWILLREGPGANCVFCGPY